MHTVHVRYHLKPGPKFYCNLLFISMMFFSLRTITVLSFTSAWLSAAELPGAKLKRRALAVKRALLGKPFADPFAGYQGPPDLKYKNWYTQSALSEEAATARKPPHPRQSTGPRRPVFSP